MSKWFVSKTTHQKCCIRVGFRGLSQTVGLLYALVCCYCVKLKFFFWGNKIKITFHHKFIYFFHFFMEYSFCVIHTFVNFTILKLPIENCRQYCGFKKFESFSVDLFYTIGKISVLLHKNRRQNYQLMCYMFCVWAYFVEYKLTFIVLRRNMRSSNVI